jgi:serine/threonine protein kinase
MLPFSYRSGLVSITSAFQLAYSVRVIEFSNNIGMLIFRRCGTNSYSTYSCQFARFNLTNLSLVSVSSEVIRGHGYSYSCEWWSLGVSTHKCLYGFATCFRPQLAIVCRFPPFVSSSVSTLLLEAQYF